MRGNIKSGALELDLMKQALDISPFHGTVNGLRIFDGWILEF